MVTWLSKLIVTKRRGWWLCRFCIWTQESKSTVVMINNAIWGTEEGLLCCLRLSAEISWTACGYWAFCHRFSRIIYLTALLVKTFLLWTDEISVVLNSYNLILDPLNVTKCLQSALIPSAWHLFHLQARQQHRTSRDNSQNSREINTFSNLTVAVKSTGVFSIGHRRPTIKRSALK